MRTNLITALALTFAAGCKPDVTNNYYTTPSDPEVVTETVTEEVIVEVPAEEPEPAVYYVPDLNDQVYETNTRLEYVDGYSFSIETAVGPDLDCLVATMHVPEDASQGVIINNLEFGGYSWDSEGTGWMDGFDTVGIGHHSMVLGEIQIFWDPDTYVGADLLYDYVTYQDEYEPQWGWQLGCLSNWCDQVVRATDPNFYVPAGNDVTVGFCAGWNQDWPNADGETDYGWPQENEQLTAVLGEIRWTPADEQNFVSRSVDGLALPVNSYFFPEGSPW